uniref:Uncharacterized protein n=1 Tax=Anguilla anguilla TaxID=7936 RepID=A0A0E9X351_ANGAN
MCCKIVFVFYTNRILIRVKTIYSRETSASPSSQGITEKESNHIL